MKKVNKEEFERFIDEYPRHLTSGNTLICSPPFTSFRDEKLPTEGKIGSADYYFDKEVARIVMDWMGPNGEIDKDNDKKFWKYMIKDSLCAK